MIPWVTTGNYLKGLLLYNENKEQIEDAQTLFINSFDNTLASFKDQYFMLTDQSRAIKNLMHVSLNFHPDDKPKLSQDVLREITDTFILNFGFSTDHPYIVYEHKDKSHPHVHIAVPMIREDGTVLGQRDWPAKKMMKICRELEQKYGLTTPERKRHLIGERPTLEAEYTEAKKAVDAALYIASLKKPNSLKQYLKDLEYLTFKYNGKEAFVASESSKKKNGITFYIAEVGSKAQLSRGIKGSTTGANYSLNRLQDKFEHNKSYRKARGPVVSKTIDQILKSKNNGLTAFRQACEKEGIQVETYLKETGEVFGITFIDNVSGIPFKGSELSGESLKSFSWNLIRNVIGEEPVEVKQPQPQELPSQQNKPPIKQKFMRIDELKNQISMIDLADSLGYKITKGKKDVSHWITMQRGDGDTILVSKLNSGIYNFYQNADNTTEKGDILRFLVNKGFVTDWKAAVAYLNNPINVDITIPVTTQRAQRPASERPAFRPIGNTGPATANDYIVKAHGIALEMIKQFFPEYVASIDHDTLEKELTKLYGKEGKDEFLKERPIYNYNIVPLFDLSRIDEKIIVGQEMSNAKGFKYLIKGSNKEKGAWYAKDSSKKKIVITESPAKSLAYITLNDAKDTSPFATIGNPSNYVIDYLVTTAASGNHLILGGDNDLKGQLFNFRIAARMAQNLYNVDIVPALDKTGNSTEFKILLRSQDSQTFEKNMERFRSLAEKTGMYLDIDKEKPNNAVLKFVVSGKETQDSEKIYRILQEFTYIYELKGLEIVKPTLKDFNDDLVQKQRQKGQVYKPKL